jgi:hypothetical protein
MVDGNELDRNDPEMRSCERERSLVSLIDVGLSIMFYRRAEHSLRGSKGVPLALSLSLSLAHYGNLPNIVQVHAARCS